MGAAARASSKTSSGTGGQFRDGLGYDGAHGSLAVAEAYERERCKKERRDAANYGRIPPKSHFPKK